MGTLPAIWGKVLLIRASEAKSGSNMTQSDSNLIWQGPSWSVRAGSGPQAVEIETGKAYIDHPGAVVLVPLIEPGTDPEVLVLRQYRPAVAATVLEVPAGTRGWEEPWLTCAQREHREETGFRAGQFISLGHVWPAPGLSNELMAIYLTTDLAADPLPQDQDEEIEVVRRPLLELVAMALDGRLADGKSVVAILRAAVHLRLWGPAAG